MRKTLNINLGGMAFIIDENAFELLHNYLEALKRKFNNEAERQEILNDIEARIGEMLTQKLADRREVVSVEDVQAIMDAMGKPEDIAGEESEPTTTGNSSQQATTTTNAETFTQPKKRLYRDADDAKVGGVISGLCHYFGINDPSWARIGALVLIPLTSGSIILLYLLLMIIVPKALTSAEKLQMKGEPININTIEKEIKDAATRTGESVNRFIHEQTFFEKLGEIILAVLKVALKVFAVFAILIGFILLAIVVFSFLSLLSLGQSPLSEISQLLAAGNHTITFLNYGILLFFGAPLIALIYGGLRILLGHGTRMRWVKWTLLGAWLIGVVLLIEAGFATVVNFRTVGISKQQTVLMQPNNGTLLVQLTDTTGKKIDKDDEDEIENLSLDERGLTVNGVSFKDINLIPVGKPDLELMVSESDSFYMQQIISSNGIDKPAANRSAGRAIYTFRQTDTVLNLTPNLYIGKNDKWRLQKMKIRIAIPEGKKIRFAENIDRWHATVKGDNSYDDTYFANTTWTVENGKVKCIAGENHFNADDKKEGESTHSNKNSSKHSKDKGDDSDKDEDKDKDF